MSEVTVKNFAIPLAHGVGLVTMLVASTLLSGCYSTGGHVPDLTRFPESVPSGALDFKKDEGKADTGKESLPVTSRLALSDSGNTRLYSFRAMGQSLRVSLMQFAEANKLNMIMDQDVAGVVNVEFHDVTLEQALDSILDPMGFGWTQEDGMIRITREVTRTYQVDYLRAARNGNTSMTSSSTGTSNSSSNSITNTDSINFWTELEAEINKLLAKPIDQQGQAAPLTESLTTTTTTGVDKTVNVTARPIVQLVGRVIIDKISGTVQVTTSPRRMRSVDDFIQNMLKGINRQVYIETRILDVTLNDDSALGINWSAVAATAGGSTLNVGTSNFVTQAGAVIAPPSTLILSGTVAQPTKNSSIQSITAAIDALQQQGTVRLVSQPKVRTLNNQPAIMKAGTEYTFYSITATQSPLNANGVPIGLPTTTEVPTVVTDGVTLSVTPQISPDGMITLDVMPVVNKIIGTNTSALGSTSPILETKQTSTLVRLKDGETAVIGGLIEQDDSESGRNVPGLGNIPGMGWLFTGKYSNKLRRELVIFITPHLIEN